MTSRPRDEIGEALDALERLAVKWAASPYSGVRVDFVKDARARLDELLEKQNAKAMDSLRRIQDVFNETTATLRSDLSRQDAENYALRSEVARLREDALRLDWLAQELGGTKWDDVFPDMRPDDEKYISAPTFRAKLDAARSSTPDTPK